MKPAVAYVRTSTGKQENSLEAQQTILRAMAALRETELVDVIVDSDEFSGDLNRPGVQRVLEMVRRKQVSAVLVTRLERLTRSTRDAVELIELFAQKGVALVSRYENLDTESPIGRFVVRMIASIAELDREMIGTRTKDGLQNLKRHGYPVGTAPYGFKARQRTAQEKADRIRYPLEPNPQEQEVVRQMRIHRDNGLSLPVIASLLTQGGHRTRRGKPWTHQGVLHILNSSEGAQSVMGGESDAR